MSLPPENIIYLHGFRSSARSVKAQQLSAFIDDHESPVMFWCEDLPASPKDAIAQVTSVIEASPSPPLIIGSSLGGYYATYLAEQHDLKAILINPACKAFELLAPWTGPHTNLYTGERFNLSQDDIDFLRTIWVPTLRHPERFWVLLETGDEVLDYRVALKAYEGAELTVIEGGDHSLKSFPRFLPEILRRSGMESPRP